MLNLHHKDESQLVKLEQLYKKNNKKTQKIGKNNNNNDRGTHRQRL